MTIIDTAVACISIRNYRAAEIVLETNFDKLKVL